jgi:acetyl esterase/lipase
MPGRHLGRRSFRRLAALGSAAFGASLLPGCSPAGILNAFVPRGGYRLAADRAYGASPRQRLDAYIPDGTARPAPAALFFCGGSWRRGAKGMYRFVGQALASRGFVAAIPDYRVFPEVSFPGFLEDGGAAFASVRDHAGEIGADPDRLFLMGHSAGAYIAAMLTLDGRWLGAVGLDPRRATSGAWSALPAPTTSTLSRGRTRARCSPPRRTRASPNPSRSSRAASRPCCSWRASTTTSCGRGTRNAWPPWSASGAGASRS